MGGVLGLLLSIFSSYLRSHIWGLHIDGELMWPNTRSPLGVFLVIHPCTLGVNQAIGEKY